MKTYKIELTSTEIAMICNGLHRTIAYIENCANDLGIELPSHMQEGVNIRKELRQRIWEVGFRQ